MEFSDISQDICNDIFDQLSIRDLSHMKATCRTVRDIVALYISYIVKNKKKIVKQEKRVKDNFEESVFIQDVTRLFNQMGVHINATPNTELSYDKIQRVIRLGGFKKINMSVYHGQYKDEDELLALIKISYKCGHAKNFTISLKYIGSRKIGYMFSKVTPGVYTFRCDWSPKTCRINDSRPIKKLRKVNQLDAGKILEDISACYRYFSLFTFSKGLLSTGSEENENLFNNIEDFLNRRVQIRLV